MSQTTNTEGLFIIVENLSALYIFNKLYTDIKLSFQGPLFSFLEHICLKP